MSKIDLVSPLFIVVILNVVLIFAVVRYKQEMRYFEHNLKQVSLEENQ